MEENNNDIVDEFVKKGVDGMNFEFNDGYWKEMEALLDSRAKSKRNIIFWWTSGIASILILALGTYTVNKSLKKDTIFAESIEILREQQESEQDQNDRNMARENSNDNLEKEDNKLVNGMISFAPSTSFGISNDTKQEQKERVAENKLDNESPEDIEYSKEIVIEQGSLPDLSIDYQSFIQQIEKRTIAEIEFEEANIFPIEASGKSQRKSINSHVELIGGIGYGTNAISSSPVRGVSGSLGLQFNLEYGRFAFNTGLSFGVNGINGMQFKETKRVYGFSSQEVVNEVKYKNMLSASVPFYLGYSGARHSFSAGVKLHLLLNASGRVNTWNGIGNSSNSWGYTNGLSNSWMSAGVDYFYRINRRFAVGLMVDYDFTDRGDANFNNMQSDLKMWNAFLGVKYRLN